MTTALDDLDPKEVGERLRVAREAVGFTQAQAAEALTVARTTLVAIEAGQRRIRRDELRTLARLYKTSINALLRTESVHVDLVPRFRRLLNSQSAAIDEAVLLLSTLTRAEVELENLLGIKRIRNYPAERSILGGDVKIQAEQDAQELRQSLGLGTGPIPDLVTLLELQLGVRVYVRELKGEISGLFAFDEIAGACILLNANHRRGRRALTAAHELAHLVTRQGVEVLDDSAVEQRREERYAHNFALCFLMPARTLMTQFRQITAGSRNLSRRHVIELAHLFGVSREGLVWRLEELKLVPKGSWDWFEKNGGITDVQEREVLGDRLIADGSHDAARRPTTVRLSLLAAAAWRQGVLSEGQLARLLRLDRVALRTLLQDGGPEGSDGDDAPRLLA